jgi:tetratricopeptide (TPR) repeat protein
MDLDTLFSEGLRHHIEGRVGAAERSYREILKLNPSHADALHHLGLIHLQSGLVSQAISEIQSSLVSDARNPNAMANLGYCFNLIGNHARASELCRAALELNPGNDGAWANLGNAQRGLRLFAEARHSYEKALALCPDNPRYVYNIGLTDLDQEKFDQAKEYFQRCLASDPSIHEAHNNLAACSLKLNDPLNALHQADRAIECKPDYAEAWNNRGNALNDLRRHEEALASFERSIELKPDYAEAWSNRGNALNDLKRHEEALASFERSIELKPDSAGAWSSRGIALSDLKRHEKALASYEISIELKPDYAEAWNNRGNALNDLRRHEEALASFERSIELKPDYAEAWSNRGNALNDLKRHEEALASFDRSIELKPDYAEAIYNKALLQLAQKNFRDGFENYLCRWAMKDSPSRPLETGLPLCDRTGGGKSLLLWTEQGIGDEIFYTGMLGQALDEFSSISLVADKRLHPTLLRSFPTITLLERDQPLEKDFLSKTECQAPIGDLGRILGLSHDTIASTRRPFLRVDGAKSSEFRSLAPFSQGKSVCGLSWSSNNKSFGEEKSIGLERLEPILKSNQFEFINLQYGNVDAEIQKVRSQCGVNIHQIDGLDIYNNVDGLLALIDACDIVITTSNITAHLAGSIGKRGCVFVPISKGKIWYWHLADVYSFWYPSLRVLYQSDRCNWTDTIFQAQKWIERDLAWKQ